MKRRQRLGGLRDGIALFNFLFRSFQLLVFVRLLAGRFGVRFNPEAVMAIEHFRSDMTHLISQFPEIASVRNLG